METTLAAGGNSSLYLLQDLILLDQQRVSSILKTSGLSNALVLFTKMLLLGRYEFEALRQTVVSCRLECHD